MKIYCGFQSWTRDIRARWLLEELGVPYEKVNIDVFKGEHKSEGFKAICPTAKVPFLEDGDAKIHESAAILMYLAEKYGNDRVVPPNGIADKAKYYQWFFYSAINIEPPAVKLFANNYIFANEADKEEVKQGEEGLASALPLLETELANKEFLVGDRFTAADVMLATTLYWADMGKGLEKYPVVKGYLTRMSQRPAWKKAYAPTERQFTPPQA